jgi:hypothetical protein
VVVAERVRLWDTIDAWMARQRVKQADIIKHGGVAGNTLWLIQQGTTTRPETETVRKIARGLASDPRTGVLDRRSTSRRYKNFAETPGSRILPRKFRPATWKLKYVRSSKTPGELPSSQRSSGSIRI